MSAAFRQAVHDGDHESVSRLLAAGQSPDEPLDAIGTTPLMAATTVEMVDALAQAGASLIPTSFGQDVLQVVVSDHGPAIADRDGRLRVARRLIALGVPLERRNENGWSRLYVAAFAGDAGAVDALLALGADPDDQPPPLGAVCWGSGEPTETARMVDSLVGAGAVTNVRDGHGWTLLHAAAMPYSHGEGFESSDGANAEAVQALIRHGIPPDVTGPDGVTPLMLVAGGGELGAAEALPAAGADRNVMDAHGLGALDHARQSERRLREVLAEASAEHTDAVRTALERASRTADLLASR